MIQTNELIKSIQDSLFQWYDFPQGVDIYIYDKKTLPLQKGKKYDFILSKADMETYENPKDLLK